MNAKARRTVDQQAALTLNAIGDAVLSTDILGRVTYLNPVAERMTGWPRQEATGRPLADVLQILDASTRERARDPMDQAVRLDRTVGLTPHCTLLVRRDGFETPIEDSASPIHDRRGRIIGFGGRVLDDSTPKYLNSPETPVFHKGRELYGLYLARNRVRHLGRLLVVEGYMDVVALGQYDINYAVATLGTATTSDHLEQLYRATPEVVFCFDGDRAGRAAAWRALETALPILREGRQARFLFLPDGEDPDSMVRKEGKERFEARLAEATPLSTFFFDELAKQVDTGSVDGRARLAELARPLLSKLPEGVFRQMMLEQLGSIVRLGTEKLAMLMGTGSPQAGENRAPAQRPPVRKAFQSTATKSPVRRAIALLLHQPALAQLAGDPRRLAELDVAGMALLVRLLDLLQAQPHLSSGAVLEHWRDTPEAESLMKLATLPLETPEAGMATEFTDTLGRLEARLDEQRMERLLSKDLNALSAEDRAEYERLRTSRTTRDRSGKT